MRRIRKNAVGRGLSDGSPQLVLLNVEVEGGNDPHFAYRAYQYNYRISDRYELPVATIVVYTGDTSQSRPSEYRREVLDTSVHFSYRTYHIFDHSPEQLLAMDNIFALIVAACQKALLEGKVPEEELGEERTAIARALLLRKRYDKDRILSFLGFLKNIIYIRNLEINSKFDTLINQITGGIIDMGVIDIIKLQERREGRLEGLLEGKQEGKLEGKQEANYEFVSNLISGTDFDDNKIAALASVPLEFVQKVRSELGRSS
ncbi:hypothetical protein [Arcticibacter sp. MXS-1]|uniref:hypothetical protein n=1 Tax=Arcticibacter sp. MXS-1 TaxID=3341726 RepID=UPI0035A931A6